MKGFFCNICGRDLNLFSSIGSMLYCDECIVGTSEYEHFKSEKENKNGDS